MKNQKQKAKRIVEEKIIELRNCTPKKVFNKDKLAELEINKFFYQGKIIDRVMVVLRANGCEHYRKNGGCSMCSHFNGVSADSLIEKNNYINQWNTVLDGNAIENKKEFNINDYSVVCVYNLGSLLNENEIPLDAVVYIFKTINQYKGVKKVIIESRAEYVREKNLKSLRNVFDNIIEVGIGVESTNNIVRELCHHKGIKNLIKIKRAIKNLHNNDCQALAYINLKPVFLTEQEAINDAVKSIIDCFNMGFDAVSIEPTSLQDYSLANYLYQLGQYRVPWLWSVREIVKEVKEHFKDKELDIRIGGYFDEEVLSGSQGVGYEEKNELFPHMTSSNCPKCTHSFIEAIKEFNTTYKIESLNKIKACQQCYDLWEQTLKIKDSRSIERRIFDFFGE